MKDRSDRTVSLESLVLGILFVAAIGMRVTRLSWPPLAPAEAVAALDAARTTADASALDPSSGPPLEPAYASTTALLFTAFGSSDRLARTVPAAAGIALLCLPLVLRRRMGRSAALLAVILLGLSPTLVMISRTAGGGALALAGLGLGWAFLGREDLSPKTRAAWMAGLLALALASGPSALTGLLGLAVGVVVHKALFRGADPAWSDLRSLPWSARRELIMFAGLLLAIATAIGTRPDGLAGLAASLSAWLQGWTRPGDLGIGTALAGLAIYEPLVLVGGVYAAVMLRSRRSLNPSLTTWALGALLVALIYPSRSAADLAWSVIPLALLAGQAVEDVVERLAIAEHKPILAILGGILILLAVFAYLQLAGYARGIGRGPEFDPSLELGLAIGALALGLVITVLFGLGWSWPLAGDAVRLVALGLLAAGTVSASWSLNYGALAATSRELWRPQAATAEVQLLLETAHGVSMSQTGWPDALPLRLESGASPVLAWTLRGFPLDVSEGALASDQPKVILRLIDGQDRPLAADYIGQTFSIVERKAWSGVLPSGLLRWMVLREAPALPEQWLLLVRADVASFGEFPAQPAPAEFGRLKACSWRASSPSTARPDQESRPSRSGWRSDWVTCTSTPA